MAIELLDDAGGFALLTVLTAASVFIIARIIIPNDGAVDTEKRAGMISSIVADAKFGLGHDPLRTLLLLSVMLGGSFSVMQISMPHIVEDVYARDAGVAGIVLGAFCIGMLISSVAVLRRAMRSGWHIALFTGIGLGLGQFALSCAANEWVAMVVMQAWGLNAGIAMVGHRTLMQTNTPPEMMGRVMGLMMLGFSGSRVLGITTDRRNDPSVLAPQLGPQMTMRDIGAATMVVTMALTFRRSIVDLR